MEYIIDSVMVSCTQTGPKKRTQNPTRETLSNVDHVAVYDFYAKYRNIYWNHIDIDKFCNIYLKCDEFNINRHEKQI